MFWHLFRLLGTHNDKSRCVVLQKRHFGEVRKKPWQALIQKCGPGRRIEKSWVCTKRKFLVQSASPYASWFAIKLVQKFAFFLIRKKISIEDISGSTGQITSYYIWNHKFKLRSSTLSNWTSSEFACVSRNLVQKTTQHFTYAIKRRDWRRRQPQQMYWLA